MSTLRRDVPGVGLIEFTEADANGRGRAYHLTDPDGKRARLVSVTTFLRVLDKPALLRWYEEQGAKAALGMERAGLLKDVALDDVAAVLRTNRLGAEDAAKTAAQRGVDIHSVLEAYVTGGVVPNPATFPPEHRGYLRALVRWLLSADARGFEVEASEQLVAHPKLGYAGRYDLRARIGGLAHLIDLKTNRHGRVWPEHHYQPVAYALADEACGAEAVHQCTIVAVGPDGHYEEMRACVGPADVKAVIDVYRRVQRLDSAIKAERDRAAALKDAA